MEALKLYWLEHPLVELKKRPVKLETRKATALLAYLSLTSGECPREVLAASKRHLPTSEERFPR